MLTDIGPPPFRFTPREPTLAAPAFSNTFKVLSSLLVGGTALWLFNLWQSGALASSAGANALESMGWVTAALGLMVYTWWHILRSRPELSATCLRQSWVWDKEIELRELAYVKLMRLPGLDWLIAPRLYARTLLGKFAVFYVADAVMLDEFKRLQLELKRFRGT